jgi:hypothetical protein
VDDDNNGIPDDAISFGMGVSCRQLPLADLIVLATTVRDTNGDGDIFADTGETARMSLILRNAGPDLSDITLLLRSSDPDILCITKAEILLPDPLPNGAVVDTATLGSAGEFEFIVSSTTETVNPANPEKGTFILTVKSRDIISTVSDVTIETLLDLDVTGGTEPDRVAGPDGIKNNRCDNDESIPCTFPDNTPCGAGSCQSSADDGLITEDFDTDRDGPGGVPDGIISISNRPRGTGGVLNDTIGVTVGTATDPGLTTLTGLECGGFTSFLEGNPMCQIDPDNDMDWHIHCPAGTCGNAEGFVTAFDGVMSFNGLNSLHWGYHFRTDSRDGDTTHVRQLAAFMTNPINLTLFPLEGELELSFFHIISTMGVEWNSLLVPGHATDFGDVHIQVDQDADPGVDDWGFWDKLVPFQNVYDHTSYVWSSFGGGFAEYCTFTPSDAGDDPDAARGKKELLCFPTGVWSKCGNVLDQSGTVDCEGPGHPGETGTGLWVESKFSLDGVIGQRIRIRWIAQSWVFDAITDSYWEVGGTWAQIVHDDGWWIDNINLTGAIESQSSPSADIKDPPVSDCPTGPDVCDESEAGADHGLLVDLQVSDSDGDGIFFAGEGVTVSAAGTTIPGGCVGGGTEFLFFKDGAMVQDWSSDPTFTDNPIRAAFYLVRARCSADPACTSSSLPTAENSETILVYRGDADEIVINAEHDLSLPETTLSWESIHQPLVPDGYDVVTGAFSTAGAGIGGAVCLGNRVAQELPAPGSPVTKTDNGADPTVGEVVFYIAGYAHTVDAVTTTLLGRKSDGTLRAELPICPPAP